MKVVKIIYTVSKDLKSLRGSSAMVVEYEVQLTTTCFGLAWLTAGHQLSVHYAVLCRCLIKPRV